MTRGGEESAGGSAGTAGPSSVVVLTRVSELVGASITAGVAGAEGSSVAAGDEAFSPPVLFATSACGLDSSGVAGATAGTVPDPVIAEISSAREIRPDLPVGESAEMTNKWASVTPKRIQTVWKENFMTK